MAQHRFFKQLEQALGIKVYFAKPYHSWERGTNTENCYTTNQSQESTCLTLLRNGCCVGYWKAGVVERREKCLKHMF